MLINENPLSHSALLFELAEEAQLPAALHKKAVAEYEHIATWLSRGGTEQYAPSIFVQGSMAQGTTVRPVGGEEFDIDLVCVLKNSEELSAMGLVTVIKERLEQHPELKKRIDPDSPPSCI